MNLLRFLFRLQFNFHLHINTPTHKWTIQPKKKQIKGKKTNSIFLIMSHCGEVKEYIYFIFRLCFFFNYVIIFFVFISLSKQHHPFLSFKFYVLYKTKNSSIFSLCFSLSSNFNVLSPFASIYLIRQYPFLYPTVFNSNRMRNILPQSSNCLHTHLICALTVNTVNNIFNVVN